MFRKLPILSFVIVLSLIFGVGASLAGSAAISGAIDSSDPTMDVVMITTPNCTTVFPFVVHYETHAFTVDTDGTYIFTVTDPGNNTAFYVFAGSFDPTNPVPTCVAASNTNPITLPVTLTAGTQYFGVVIDDTFAQLGMTYTLAIDGPGAIAFGFPEATTCTYPLPQNSVLYSVPGGAPAYFNPDLQSGTNFSLPAGTWKISEFSGDFAKVWIACEAQPVWIPTAALGGVTS